MNMKVTNLITIFIIIFSLENKSIKAKICYHGNVFADWELKFKSSNINNNVFTVEVQTCYLGFFYFTDCWDWAKITSTSSQYHFNGSTSVTWGINFYTKVYVTHEFSGTTNDVKATRSCYYWPSVNCYSCRENTLSKCITEIDLTKPGEECNVKETPT
uniref:S-protein homolog n=1 Tax=Parastrongyloides trichosuri TaxID=131310 RepID=A0A0N4Z7R5_PARTI